MPVNVHQTGLDIIVTRHLAIAAVIHVKMAVLVKTQLDLINAIVHPIGLVLSKLSLKHYFKTFKNFHVKKL